MKKNLIISILLYTLCSCNVPNEALKSERAKWHYQNWKQDFKDYTFCKCLLKGYEDKTVVEKIELLDKSDASAINYAVFDSTVQQILKPVILQMKKDSLESISTISEFGAGKKVFNGCLTFYKSKRLDSITVAESGKWDKIKSIDLLIEKKMPAF